MTTSQFLLDGDVAVITGAGSGIGEGTAHVLANAGARIVCALAAEQAEIERVANRHPRRRRRSHRGAHRCDCRMQTSSA